MKPGVQTPVLLRKKERKKKKGKKGGRKMFVAAQFSASPMKTFVAVVVVVLHIHGNGPVRSQHSRCSK
jgi:hypothetical protein